MIYERIKQEYERLNSEILSINHEISQLPDGRILCPRNGKYYRWRQTDGHKSVTIPKSNRSLAETLAYKEYLYFKLNNLTNEKEALNLYLEHHQNHTQNPEDFFNTSPELQNLLSTYISPLSDELNTWANEPYQRNTSYEKHLIHKTSLGYYVRSKSESLIATYLHLHKIPFRYECLLKLGDAILYPDFTIRHPSTGAYYYWDHFGSIDKPKYSKDAFSKLLLYSSYGLYPSINLITTYETKAHPLSSETIENTIKQYFL